MNNILVRTLSGSIFISLVLIPLFIANSIYAIIVLSLFMLLGLIEYNNLFNNSSSISINKPINLFFALTIYLSVLLVIVPQFYIFNSLVFIFPLLFGWSLTELWRKKENPLANIGASLYSIIYICLPFLLAIHIHLTDTMSHFPILVGMFVLIWTNDTFAFLSGMFFGKTKLFERISPKKTWEGTIGGIILTLAMAFALSYFFDKENSVFWIISAFLISLTSILGDLFESLFKRSLNIKDTGNIMPGHGGILDRFDAFLFTVPFFYFWIQIYFN
ncbi:MAG: phosphatidate cytidylyltransferase [Crocinitomicaceae bacterium]|nr:phosphatidate cytidylyltransferase [Crocinitomicaceae bacterium]